MIVRLPRAHGWLNLNQVVVAYDEEPGKVSVRTVDGGVVSYLDSDAEAIRFGLDNMAAAFGGAFVVGEPATSGSYVPPDLPADESGEVKG